MITVTWWFNMDTEMIHFRIGDRIEASISRIDVILNRCDYGGLVIERLKGMLWLSMPGHE